MADIFDLGEHALRHAARKGSGYWTGEDGIDWTAETTGPITRSRADHCAGGVDLCGEGADRLPADDLDGGPGLAPGDPACRAGRAHLLGSDETVAGEHQEPPEEVTP